MPLRDTVERLRHARAEPNELGYDAEGLRNDVARLYQQITNWLEPFVEDGGIVLKRQSKHVYEERLGPYQIDNSILK